VINKKEATGKDKEGLKPNDIESINVLKDAPAFGPGGANGVVLIYMKKYKVTGIVTLKDGTKIKMEGGKIGVTTPPVKVSDVPKKAGDDVNVIGVRVYDTVHLAIRDTTNVSVDRPRLALVKTRDGSVLDKPLFLLDGKVISAEEMNKIDPGTIASINVIKNEDAIAIYGSRAKDGVILITSKQPGFKGPATITSVTGADTVRGYADTVLLRPATK
jgi:TonB-dependent SusC/RagA subfamily outer membrane receptor